MEDCSNIKALPQALYTKDPNRYENPYSLKGIKDTVNPLTEGQAEGYFRQLSTLMSERELFHIANFINFPQDPAKIRELDRSAANSDNTTCTTHEKWTQKDDMFIYTVLNLTVSNRYAYAVTTFSNGRENLYTFMKKSGYVRTRPEIREMITKLRYDGLTSLGRFQAHIIMIRGVAARCDYRLEEEELCEIIVRALKKRMKSVANQIMNNKVTKLDTVFEYIENYNKLYNDVPQTNNVKNNGKSRKFKKASKAPKLKEDDQEPKSKHKQKKRVGNVRLDDSSTSSSDEEDNARTNSHY